ncbi:MAG TPA: glycosyltransferase family 4 protein [Azospirillaceae bacterium]|nr:glycosyltransferase family 4 protein [Azospirillaceae bacterium]
MRPPLSEEKPRVLLLFWGRRGALSRFTVDLARAASAGPFVPLLSVSRQNELIDELRGLGVPTLEVDTIGSVPATLARTLGLPRLARRVAAYAEAAGVSWVVTLMPHIWSPFLVGAVQARGIRYATVVHDAVHHPGEGSALLDKYWEWEFSRADRVVALSTHVARRVEARVPETRIATLFHPTMGYAPAAAARTGRPSRLLFFGRILAYKGLDLLLDAYANLRADGVSATLTIVGDGDLAPFAGRLPAPGVEVHNRWVPHAEVGSVLGAHDIVVLPYIEASQSGVVAAAHAAGLPVVATPVGGLREQVSHGVDGLLAAEASAAGVADAIRHLIEEPGLYETCARGAAATAKARSMPAFVEALASALAVEGGPAARSRAVGAS